MKYTIGIDLGGTNIAAGLVDENYKIIRKTSVPTEARRSADEITEENSSVTAAIFEALPKIAAAEGLSNGYRIITNCGEDGCQSVKHLHFHILGGKKLPDQLA